MRPLLVTLGLKEFTEDKYSAKKHLSHFQSEALKETEKRSAEFPNLVSSLADDYEKSFRSDLNTLIDLRTRTLEAIKKSKADNDEILENIERAEQKKKSSRRR